MPFSKNLIIFILLCAACSSAAPIQLSPIAPPIKSDDGLIEEIAFQERQQFKDVQDDKVREFIEKAIRFSLPNESLDISQLFIEYGTDPTELLDPPPGLLDAPFVLKGRLTNNHERFVMYKALVRVAIEDCGESSCSIIGVAGVPIEQRILTLDTEEVSCPVTFSHPLNLRGKMKVTISLLANWSYLHPVIKEMEEAEAKRELDSESPVIATPDSAPAPVK